MTMARLLATMRTDVTVQVRNRLYVIGPVFAVILGLLVRQVSNTANHFRALPVTMLLIIGGSTLLYVAALIVFERDEGTLSALSISPLTRGEYLSSKVLTLTVLAALESAIIVGIVTRFGGFSLVLLMIGVILMAIQYTLIGVVMIVRYRGITEFLIPMAAWTLILELPALHFLGLLEHPLFLLIPTSAPTMLMQGAWIPLVGWEWAYAVGYTVLGLVVLALWSHRAFYRHIIMKAG